MELPDPYWERLEKIVMRVLTPLMMALAAGTGYVATEHPSQTRQCTGMVASLVEYHLDEQAKAVAAALDSCEEK